MFAIGAALWPKLRAFQIYGANTNVGKTIASAILCRASHERLKLKTHYLKPVSTGPLNEADNGYVFYVFESFIELYEADLAFAGTFQNFAQAWILRMYFSSLNL